MSKKIRIIIAEAHRMLAEGLALALNCQEAISVCAVADDGRQLIAAISKYQPDVILLDLNMLVMSGWETLPIIKKNHPRCKVLIFSMYFQSLSFKELTAHGAHGFLSKSSDFQSLIAAIEEVFATGYFYDKKIKKTVVAELFLASLIKPQFKNAELSDMELAALLLICEDKVTKEIANDLHYSLRNATRLKSQLFTKTGTKTSAGLFLYALRNKLIQIPKLHKNIYK